MDRINKKQILFWIIVFFLLSLIAFDRLFYSHNTESLDTKKDANLPEINFFNNGPLANTVLVPDNFSIDKPITDFVKPIVDKVKTSITPQTTTNTTSSTTTPVATTTTTIVKTILPPESPVDYKDNGNGTITDNYTKLMWAKCTQGNTGKDCKSGSPSTKEWSRAREECASLKLANKTGWRLPTLKELEFIVDTGSFSPSINKTFFLNTASSPYWTSTSPAQYPSSKFTVLFSDGSVYFKDGGNMASTRCVRDNI